MTEEDVSAVASAEPAPRRGRRSSAWSLSVCSAMLLLLKRTKFFAQPTILDGPDLCVTYAFCLRHFVNFSLVQNYNVFCWRRMGRRKVPIAWNVWKKTWPCWASLCRATNTLEKKDPPYWSLLLMNVITKIDQMYILYEACTVSNFPGGVFPLFVPKRRAQGALENDVRKTA